MFWVGRSQIYKIKEIASALLRSHDEAIEVHGERVTGGLTEYVESITCDSIR